MGHSFLTSKARHRRDHELHLLVRVLASKVALPIAVIISVIWLVTYLRINLDSTDHSVARAVGLAMVGVSLLGAYSSSRMRRASAPETIARSSPRAHEDISIEAQTIAPADREVWAQATARMLTMPGLDATVTAPEFVLMRVGRAGVELLLHEPHPLAPPPFRAESGGLVWALDRSLRLEQLAVLAQMAPEMGTSTLVEVGTDEDASYFAPADGAVRLLLDDELHTDELADALPFPLIDLGEPERAAAQLAGAALVVVERGEERLLEPLGISLRVAPARSLTLPALEEDAVALRELETLLVEEALRFTEAQVDEDELLPDIVEDAGEPGAPEFDLPIPPGVVEVRILRDAPDLVGRVRGEVTDAGVEILAYLALHGHRAVSARLKDVLGTPRAQSSPNLRSVWTAAGEARQAIGDELLPAASASQLYLLSEEVSCDWTRCQGLIALAEEAGCDPATRRTTLLAALELVEGVPGLASRRFTWLATEGILADIVRLVLEAARSLAAIASEEHDEELARFACRKAQLIAPGVEDLTDWS